MEEVSNKSSQQDIVVTQEFKKKISEILRKNSNLKSKSSFVNTER